MVWPGTNLRKLPIAGCEIYRLGRIEAGLEHVDEIPFRLYFDLRSEWVPTENDIRHFTRMGVKLVRVSIVDESDFRAKKQVNARDILVWYQSLLVQNRRNFSFLVKRLARVKKDVGFGCYAGKDRTGIVAFLLLSYLGINQDQICADYAQSESELRPNAELFRRNWEKRGITREEYLDRLISPAEAMVELDEWLTRRFGGIYAYIAG